MNPESAQYLIRFDDLCPTMNRRRWERFLPLLERYSIRPILAIVPDNQDPELNCSVPDPGFWSRMRALEAAGATIGLHGFRHLCWAAGKSLVPLHRSSEFAGVPLQTQRHWIATGLQILRDRGLQPRIWVAPRHGFDRNTLAALRAEGIDLLSDGLAQRPHLREGLVWIPQRLWAPTLNASGLWTICIHPNTASDEFVESLQKFLSANSSQLTSVDRVTAELSSRPLNWRENISMQVAILRLQVKYHRTNRSI